MDAKILEKYNENKNNCHAYFSLSLLAFPEPNEIPKFMFVHVLHAISCVY